MLGLGRKKNSAVEAPQISADAAEKIRTMPDRFYIKRRQQNSRLMGGLAVILIIGGMVLIAAAVFVYLKNQSEQVEIPLDEPDEILPTQSGPPAPSIPPIASPSPTVPAFVPTPIPVPQPTPTAEPIIELDTEDLDSDGLTAEEERLFFTNFNNADTDADGYRDSDELIAGFDPRAENRTLAESEIVTAYSFFGYRLWYPAQWGTKVAGPLLILDSRHGDSIGIQNEGNPERTEPLEWIAENHPTINTSTLVRTSLRNFSTVYKTADGLGYFIFSDDATQVLVFNYQASQGPPLAFYTAFQMVVNSLE